MSQEGQDVGWGMGCTLLQLFWVLSLSVCLSLYSSLSVTLSLCLFGFLSLSAHQSLPSVRPCAVSYPHLTQMELLGLP